MLTRGGREFSPMSLLFPALCDTAASIMLFTGLYLTYATSFQMIRGIYFDKIKNFNRVFPLLCALDNYQIIDPVKLRGVFSIDDIRAA